ncbi:uncharacterized protein [Antedon mediterranea]|uniref:uncharacterized protein n=1 Tax=Antedon mediterranea TaxID=105859 RepID=UPI003AF422B8
MAQYCRNISRVTKKDLIVYLSFTLCGLLFLTILNDIVGYSIERTDKTTQNITTTILLNHVVSFYLALLGFVYNTQAGKNWRHAYREWIAIVSNCLVCILRVVVELTFINYRPEEYRNFSDSGK